jgi:hypothetical protein
MEYLLSGWKFLDDYMSVSLAATWQPRGELPRLLELLPQMRQIYVGMVIVLPPDVDPGLVTGLQSDAGSAPPTVVSPDWSWGRHLALREALAFDAGHIHYADLDRLLRWVETRPEEWKDAVEKIRESDCLILGRTKAAYRTHPQALVRTEQISNRAASYLLGRPVDVSAGSKGFSRRAVEFLMVNSPPGRALGTDAEWPVLLKRAGYRIDDVRVEGLDWEIPDQHQSRAAGAERQAMLAGEYDADPQNWARRVEVALEIVASGLEASSRELIREE